MKLRIDVDIACSLCNKLVPGEAYVWTKHGWSVDTFFDDARPKNDQDGIITSSSGQNQFTCKECYEEKHGKRNL